ncbi:hypothetical protein PIB30_081675 [Stylosanthes scabra]|uniref:Uncharacterized protein n=1 Tax=Stylosanthes scabra TaxID=79078 RepID=A0ABU6YSD2_9FABA|nr:hypothetical protein [Stylosanthes scabra]
MPRLDVVGSQRELGATKKKGNKGEATDKRHNKSMPMMTATQNKGKEADDARKGVKTHALIVETKDSQRTLAATQVNKGKQVEAATKKLKKPVHTKLDFSHLKSTLDVISNRDSATSAPLEEQQSLPIKRSENTRENPMDTTAIVKKRRVVQGEPSAQCLHNSEPAERDRTKLRRKLEEIRRGAAERNARHAGHERSSENSASIEGNHGQQNNMQVTHERVQERDHDTTSSDSEPNSEDEEENMEQDGRKRGKREAMIKATTIDEFLKENGIDLENVLASLDLPIDGPSTEPSYDGNDSSALHADYYNQVMADVDDKQDNILDSPLLFQGSQRRTKLVEKLHE